MLILVYLARQYDESRKRPTWVGAGLRSPRHDDYVGEEYYLYLELGRPRGRCGTNPIFSLKIEESKRWCFHLL